MVEVVQERPVFAERQAVVDHGVHARLILESAPARIAVLNQGDEKRHSALRLQEPEL
jgi:hypothetical protein